MLGKETESLKSMLQIKNINLDHYKTLVFTAVREGSLHILVINIHDRTATKISEVEENDLFSDLISNIFSLIPQQEG